MVVLDTEPSALSRGERLGALFDRLAESQGQRNAIDAQIVAVAAELERHELWKDAGTRSLEACLAWRLGSSRANASAVAAVARRGDEFPVCAAAFEAGRLSLDQTGTIAARAPEGSDEHYAQFAEHASVAQLRRAITLARQPSDDGDAGDDHRFVHRISEAEYAEWRVRLPHVEAAVFDAALQSHLDALVAEWRRDHDENDGGPEAAFPTVADAFVRLVEAGWDVDVARRPHGHRTTVVMHLDVEARVGSLHLGPVLSDAERRYLSCDARFEVWFERDGRPIGCGRTTREVPLRLRRALEHRSPGCVVPGCETRRGLHAHHVVHWEDGGATDLDNLVLVCGHHHRAHHRGVITIRGPGGSPTVLDRHGMAMRDGPVPRPPSEPVPPAPSVYRGPSGERFDWHVYDPFVPPPSSN